jgi:CubicO group peptidase (beta-lactamase class C family)
MHRRDFIALSGASLIAPRALAAGTQWARDFSDYIQSQLTATNTPGMSVAAVKGGRIVFARGYGYADVEKARPVTPDTVFQIASVSKTVTATAMMMLWQDGAFKLDEPVAPHLDFAVGSLHMADTPITFRHLFTHTSGISDAIYNDLDFSSGPLPSLRDFLTGYLTRGGRWYDSGKTYTDAKPGTAWHYSNVGVALLGYLAGRVNPDPLEKITAARIFSPLGLHNTAWRYEGIADTQLAQPYDFENAHFHHLPRTRYPDWPAGLLWTSANDFAKFLSIYTQNGRANGHAFLKPETITAMFTADPVLPNAKSPNLRQGLIWELAPLEGGEVALHPGGDPGASTLVAIDRTHGIAALAFANGSPAKSMTALQKEVIRRLLDRAREG